VFLQENVDYLIQELRRPKYSIYYICKYVLFRASDIQWSADGRH